MTGDERLLLANIPHHVIRKSPRRSAVFLDKKDYMHCIEQMCTLARECEIMLHAWCVLPDRFHLLVTPGNNPQVLSTFMKALSCRTALHHNEQYEKTGSPWERRYRSSPVEPGEWALACMCYIEQLPVMCGLTKSAFLYHCSSYRMRLGKTPEYCLDDLEAYSRLGDTPRERREGYRLYMRAGRDAKELDTISTAVLRGRLTGSERFLQYIYDKHGIDARNRGPGRPRKTDRKGKPNNDTK